MRQNTIFGSALSAQADLAISDADINCVDFGGGNKYLVVTVHNQGSADASNVVVRVNQSGGIGCPVDKIINSISPGSTGTVNFSGETCAYCGIGGTFIVTVDPNNNIAESNENNNSITKTFP